ncbi:oxidoreductase, partial [Atractiella rhizophila]
MKYVRLGKSGLKVSRIILGTMTYGGPKGTEKCMVLPEETGIEHIKEAWRLGINTFDTANVYSNGLSEVCLGKALKELNVPREKVVIMTKVYFCVGDTPGYSTVAKTPDQLANDGYVNRHGLSRKHIFDSVQASLKRLQVDYIDLLQCHRFDHDTPIEETMQALHDVVQKGWVRYIGMSSCWAYQFHIMQNYAINNKLTPFISMQNQYSAIYREEERRSMHPTLEHFGVGSVTWSTLGRGLLTRPWNAAGHRTGQDSALTPFRVYDRVEAIAKKRGKSMAVIALAWSLSKKAVSAPIVGTSKIESIKELCEAVEVELTDEEIRAIEEPYIPRLIDGH